MLEHLHHQDRVHGARREWQARRIREQSRPRPIAVATHLKAVQADVRAPFGQLGFRPPVTTANIKHPAARPSTQPGKADPFAPDQPLRVEGRGPYQPSQGAHHSGFRSEPPVRLYTSEVICSETSPIKNTITEALNSKVLMLV